MAEFQRYRDSSLQSSSSADTDLELKEKSHETPYQDEISLEDNVGEARDALLPRHAANQAIAADPKVALEYTVPTSKKFMALGIYFLCNVGLTLYNKAVLGSLQPFGRREAWTLCAFSLLFTVNIAISNVSLGMVSIPFHQVVRATSPLVTTGIYRVFYGRTYSRATYLTLLPIILGVGLATYGDYSWTMGGLLMTLLGVLLGAMKTIASNQIMTGSLKLAPLEFLFRMSPLACVQSLIYGIWTGEFASLRADIAPMRDISKAEMTYGMTGLVLIILCNGLLAFCLNVSSFTTNKLVGALTMTVCGNLKVCLTIILGVVLFNVTVGFSNALGLLITMLGVAAYSSVELVSKRKKTPAPGSV
ncbi:hypothetical protein LTR84_008622 [Exophiala bonariae]|uniref:Sugar phosphate transporter domain-containing protein n=1 Tax=Exophiala bonariae TaxID=1690606 RepID=A0AAV9MYZ2_9EURO|nr:hypothetical protein LTR84_008622 [Exophiala bonariae]